MAAMKSGTALSGSAKKNTTRKRSTATQTKSARPGAPKKLKVSQTRGLQKAAPRRVISRTKPVPEKFDISKVPIPQVDYTVRHHRHHTAAWLILVMITLLSLTTIAYAYMLMPRETALSDQQVDTAINAAVNGAGSTCSGGYCTGTEANDINTVNTNVVFDQHENDVALLDVNMDQNIDVVAVEVSATEIQVANGVASTSCVTTDDCALVDATYDNADCCVPPNCIDYSSDEFVAANKESYIALREAAQAQCTDVTATCPTYSAPTCAGSEQNSEYSVECLENVCQKLRDGKIVPLGE